MNIYTVSARHRIVEQYHVTSKTYCKFVLVPGTRLANDIL